MNRALRFTTQLESETRITFTSLALAILVFSVSERELQHLVWAGGSLGGGGQCISAQKEEHCI